MFYNKEIYLSTGESVNMLLYIHIFICPTIHIQEHCRFQKSCSYKFDIVILNEINWNHNMYIHKVYIFYAPFLPSMQLTSFPVRWTEWTHIVWNFTKCIGFVWISPHPKIISKINIKKGSALSMCVHTLETVDKI